jgi:hypothetical protein
MANRPNAKAPWPIGRTDPDKLNVGMAPRQYRIERQRMADCETKVAGFDLAAE